MSFSGLTRSFAVGVLICSCWPSFAQYTAPKNRVDNSAADSQNIPGNTPVLYEAWLDEDVRWIITDAERAAFKQLSNNEERDNFILAFWQRRNPKPDELANDFKNEHYTRISYANEHFGAAVPGWKSERGRIYIVYGPPDKIESYPHGVPAGQPGSNEASTSVYPRQVWRYRYLEDVGQDVALSFVDRCRCGDYSLMIDEAERDALLQTPTGLSRWRETFGDPATTPTQPSVIQLFIAGVRPPRVRFQDLEEVVTHRLNVTMVPFTVRTDSLRLTSFTALVRITIEIQDRDLNFSQDNGSEHNQVNIFGRLTTHEGHVAETFEDSFQANPPHEPQPEARENPFSRVVSIPLSMGQYHLNVVVKDVKGDRVGTWGQDILAR